MQGVRPLKWGAGASQEDRYARPIALGTSLEHVKDKAISRVTQVAEMASKWLWNRRDKQWGSAGWTQTGY